MHPAFDIMALETSFLQAGQAIFGKPGAWVSPAKLAHVSAKVLEACDGRDCLKDGLIRNVRACRAVFDIASLRCAGGADTGPGCLSDTQIATLRWLTAPRNLGVTLSSIDAIAPWPMLESDATPGTTAFGRSDEFQNSFASSLGGGAIRFMVMKDTNFDLMTSDPATHSERLQQLSQEMDVKDALSPFVARGGKLLLMHGNSGMLIPPGNSVAYYERLRREYGATLSSFARFHMVPGQAHGGGAGNFLVGWDALGTLDACVTKGKAPGLQAATDTNKATAGRTRPLCEYPAYPRYNGSGDINQAASLTCAMP